MIVIVDFRVRSGIDVLGMRLGRSRWCLLFSWDGDVVSHVVDDPPLVLPSVLVSDDYLTMRGSQMVAVAV